MGAGMGKLGVGGGNDSSLLPNPSATIAVTSALFVTLRVDHLVFKVCIRRCLASLGSPCGRSRKAVVCMVVVY